MSTIKIGTIGWTVFVMRTISRILKLYLAFFLLAFGLSFIKNVDQYPIATKVIEIQRTIERPMVKLIRENLLKTERFLTENVVGFFAQCNPGSETSQEPS